MNLQSLQEDMLNIQQESNEGGVFMFKDVSGDPKEMKNELNKLPEEVVDGDGADELPDEIGLDDETNDMENDGVDGSEKTEGQDTLETGNEKVEEVNEGKEGLTDEEKQRIKKEVGWSDDVIDNIRSMEEYEIYKKAGLQEVQIGEKKALIRNDIDWNQTDEKGRTNEERIKKGLAPLDKDGNPIELHHIGQHADSPLAELTFKEHRCDGNDTILHDKKKETETHGEGNNWDNERQNYWKDRSEYNEDAENNKGGQNG